MTTAPNGMPAIAPPPPGMPPPPPTGISGKAVDLTNIDVPKFEKKTSEFRPPRLIVVGVEGWGKTTLGALAPDPAIVQIRGETGYDTLLGAGLVPAVPCITANSWPVLLAAFKREAESESPHKTYVTDALGGAETLCHEFVCDRDFNGDWGEKGFASFQKGYDVAVPEWISFLDTLDALHQRGSMIILLSHANVVNFKNPLGEDFDRYAAALHKKTWAPTRKWADAIFFATYRTLTHDRDAQGRKTQAKGIGGTQRVIFTERRDAFDAKNRYSMPPELDVPDGVEHLWPLIWANIPAANKGPAK